MSGRLKVSIAALALLFGLLGGLFYLMFGGPWKEKPPYRAIVKSNMHNLALLLEKYYADPKFPKTGDIEAGFVDFIEAIREKEGGFTENLSTVPPREPYTCPGNHAIHLMLPPKLEAERPTIIAYTSYEGPTLRPPQPDMPTGTLILVDGKLEFLEVNSFLPYLIRKTKNGNTNPELYVWGDSGRSYSSILEGEQKVSP